MANVPGLDYGAKPVYNPTKNRDSVLNFETKRSNIRLPRFSGGGSGIIGSVISAGAGLLDSYLNRNYAKQADELNYSRYLEERRYNSPAAAAARMRAAGLDPRAVTGQIASSAAASGTPQFNDPGTGGSIASGGAAAAQNLVAAGQMDIDSMRQAVEAEKAYSDMFVSSKTAERIVKEVENLSVQGLILQSQQRVQSVVEQLQTAPISVEATYENGKQVGYRLYGGTLHLQHIADELRYTLDELKGQFEIGKFFKGSENLMKTYENNVWTDFLVSSTMRVLAGQGKSVPYYQVLNMAEDFISKQTENQFLESNQIIGLIGKFIQLFK